MRQVLSLHRMAEHHKKKEKSKLCFILPEYSETTHFRYVAELARSLADETDVFLVAEKGDDSLRAVFPAGFYRQRCSFGLLRALENFIVLLSVRFKGYRTFYIHYSFVSAISAGLITNIFGGTVYYWNAGMPWKYPRDTVRESTERLAYKLIDYLVTGAQALVPGYSAYYGIPVTRIIVIPNWVEPPRAHAESLRAMVAEDIARPAEARVLLFVHRLARRKGAHHLPEILHRLKDESIVMVVIGDGPERAHLEEEFRRLDVAHKVHMLGERSNEYVEAALERADVFLLPSEEEGSPHALLEALAAGVPFVAFNVGGVYEHTPPDCASYAVPEGDLTAFVSRVQELLHSPGERKRVGEAEKKFIIKFTKARILQMFKKKIL